MTPPWPPMFSTTTGWPSSLDMPCASPRAKMSEGPPGGKGTMRRTGLAGYGCASTASGSAATARRKNQRLSEAIESRRVVDEQSLALRLGGRDLGEQVDEHAVIGNFLEVGMRPIGAP